MGGLFAAALGLAVAGLDPVGALIAISALASGMRMRWIIVFGLVVLAGTALLGSFLSLTIGRQLADIDWTFLIPDGAVGAVAELVIAALLLGWAYRRLRKPDTSARKPQRKRSGGPALVAFGALFAVSAVLDPTFVGLVVVAGRGEPVWQVFLAHSLWALISQLPLTVLLIAVAFRRHDRLVAWFQRWWGRQRTTVQHILTAVLALAGLVLVVDGGWYFATGEFLIPGP
ncbi:hypothetical protein [Arthrobacter sp. H5]|uniref:hypothetical protein n=1 Tax=Arthrobacter sp. H5 TaxID=1267973 RepID=UPI0004880368|nr:hypothetical protein [Arthrobacter sp. H5]